MEITVAQAEMLATIANRYRETLTVEVTNLDNGRTIAAILPDRIWLIGRDGTTFSTNCWERSGHEAQD